MYLMTASTSGDGTGPGTHSSAWDQTSASRASHRCASSAIPASDACLDSHSLWADKTIPEPAISAHCSGARDLSSGGPNQAQAAAAFCCFQEVREDRVIVSRKGISGH